MEAGSQSQRQSALTVGDPPLDSEEGHASEATNMPIIIDKGNNMIDCLSIFEVGSTSGTCNARISLTPAATAHRGKTNLEVELQNADLLKNFVHLKEIPDCKFCGAKRLQYEPPKFCCGSGSIKLTSHQLPLELRNLYLGNTEESKHFRTYSRTYNNMFAFTSLGVNYDRVLAKRNCGIYTFKVQGQMYHFINNLIPSGKRAKNLQLYFF
nr:uncharacterized protein LOC117274492 isoform X2 [Nicotiana tomentosiformis]